MSRARDVFRRVVTEKDLSWVENAMKSCEEIKIEREMQGVYVAVSTTPATPVWECSMLVRVQTQERNVYSTQFFKYVEEMRRYL